MNKLTIIGIADGKLENITIKANHAIMNAERVMLQTGEIPILSDIERDVETCDDLYQEAEDFDALKKKIAEKVVLSAKQQDTVFCVLGDIAQNQIAGAVIAKANAEQIETEWIYGLPCGCDAISYASNQHPVLPSGIRFVSGHGFEALENNHEGVLIYEIDSPFLASEIKLKLLNQLHDKQKIVIADSESVREITLETLDRQTDYGYDFSAYIPPVNLEQKAGFTYQDLVEIMQRLRSDGGCPWDREQTHDTLKRYLIEEAYEVYDAIIADDMDMLYDELGDVLLQVVFHAQIAKEHRAFDALDVTTAICLKMINRHPHVFGDVQADTPDQVLENWEQIKKTEKGIENFTHNLKDVPKAMPSLMRAQKVQKRAAACGFDWADYRLPLEKIYEELDELKSDIAAEKDPTEEMGDVLFAATNLARHLKVEAETVLYNGVEKFIHRFELMEQYAEKAGRSLNDMTLEEMDVFWEKSKSDIKDKPADKK